MAAAATESSSTAKKVEEARSAVIGWAVGVLTSIALIVSGYSMNGVSKLETRTAVTENNFVTVQKSLEELKIQQREDTKEMRRDQQKLNDKIDRIVDAVGAKRP